MTRFLSISEDIRVLARREVIDNAEMPSELDISSPWMQYAIHATSGSFSASALPRSPTPFWWIGELRNIAFDFVQVRDRLGLEITR